MYKWPQGRLIRIIILMLSLLIAGDLGYTGAFAKFAAVSGQSASGHGQLRMIILGSIFAAASATALIGGLIAAGFHKRSVQFLIDVEHEMTLVEWPSKGTLFRSTVVIAVVMVVLSALIVGVDAVNHAILFDLIFNKLGAK